MIQKVAIAAVHGIGPGDKDVDAGRRQDPIFMRRLKASLSSQFKRLGLSEAEIVDRFEFVPVYWAPVLEIRQKKLWEKLKGGGTMNWSPLRLYLLSFFSDAIAYQIGPQNPHTYNAIHGVFAQSLHRLSNRAGDRAPLCIVAHSLGTIVATTYLSELEAEFRRETTQSNFIDPVRRWIGNTPLERGETLSHLYTLGSPLPFWSLRFNHFGEPPAFPTPDLLYHYPNVQPEWINFYDKDDILGYPLRSLNAAYRQSVTADRQVNVGNLLESWTPLSHVAYWRDRDVTGHVAKSLLNLSRTVNG